MSRVIDVKEMIFNEINKKCIEKKKIDAYYHLSSVSSLCAYLANERGLDKELGCIIGLLHDCSSYLLNSSFDHANRSSELSRKLLYEMNLFNHEEITIICNAIRNHSDKGKIHDEYSELIKDADVLAQYFSEMDAVFNKDYTMRLNKLLAK
jgi:HD superfamily phosphodiesterase